MLAHVDLVLQELGLRRRTSACGAPGCSTAAFGGVDQFGNVVTSDNTDTLTLSLGTNPSGGTLSGTLTVTVSGGIATFSNLSIDQVSDGYTLHATTTGLADADSVAFSIT
jgi:hypothetical protein